MHHTVYCRTCPGRVGVDVDCSDPTHDHHPQTRVVVFCETCGGHLGFDGSPAVHCADETHAHVIERWDERDGRSWVRWYAREATVQRIHTEAEAQRVARPLLERLRDCGVRPASDGIMSIHPADWRDAHDAAEVIEGLLETAETLSTGDAAERIEAATRLAEIRAGIDGRSGTG